MRRELKRNLGACAAEEAKQGRQGLQGQQGQRDTGIDTTFRISEVLAVLTVLCVLASGFLIFAAGCGPKQPAGGHDYTVRAQVVQPPAAATGLYIYHEAIDDWVSRDGKVEGMDTMAMPFPVAKGVALDGIQANDKVEVTLHVDWASGKPVEITRVRKLPADTKLEFRAARPPKNQ